MQPFTYKNENTSLSINWVTPRIKIDGRNTIMIALKDSNPNSKSLSEVVNKVKDLSKILTEMLFLPKYSFPNIDYLNIYIPAISSDCATLQHVIHAVAKIAAVALKMDPANFEYLNNLLLSEKILCPHTSTSWATIANSKITLSLFLKDQTPYTIADLTSKSFLEDEYKKEKQDSLIVFYDNPIFRNSLTPKKGQDQFLEQLLWIINKLKDNQDNCYFTHISKLIDQLQNNLKPNTSQSNDINNLDLNISNDQKKQIINVINDTMIKLKNILDENKDIIQSRHFSKLMKLDPERLYSLIWNGCKENIDVLYWDRNIPQDKKSFRLHPHHRNLNNISDKLSLTENTIVEFRYPDKEHTDKIIEFEEKIEKLLQTLIERESDPFKYLNSKSDSEEIVSFFKLLSPELIEELNQQTLFNLYVVYSILCQQYDEELFDHLSQSLFSIVQNFPTVAQIAYYLLDIFSRYNLSAETIANYDENLLNGSICSIMKDLLQLTPLSFRLQFVAALINTKSIPIYEILHDRLINPKEISLLNPLIRRVNLLVSLPLKAKLLNINQPLHLTVSDLNYNGEQILEKRKFEELRKLEVISNAYYDEMPRIIPSTLSNLTTLTIIGHKSIKIQNLPKLKTLVLISDQNINHNFDRCIPSIKNLYIKCGEFSKEFFLSLNLLFPFIERLEVYVPSRDCYDTILKFIVQSPRLRSVTLGLNIKQYQNILTNYMLQDLNFLKNEKIPRIIKTILESNHPSLETLIIDDMNSDGDNIDGYNIVADPKFKRFLNTNRDKYNARRDDITPDARSKTAGIIYSLNEKFTNKNNNENYMIRDALGYHIYHAYLRNPKNAKSLNRFRYLFKKKVLGQG